MRKIFGSQRSVKSAKTWETNMSVLDTLSLNNPNKTFMQVILPHIKKLRGDKGKE